MRRAPDRVHAGLRGILTHLLRGKSEPTGGIQIILSGIDGALRQVEFRPHGIAVADRLRHPRRIGLGNVGRVHMGRRGQLRYGRRHGGERDARRTDQCLGMVPAGACVPSSGERIVGPHLGHAKIRIKSAQRVPRQPIGIRELL